MKIIKAIKLFMRGDFAYGFRADDFGGVDVLSIPATPKPDIRSRCGHEYDCCGCRFVAWHKRGFCGLWSWTAYRINI